MLPRHLRRATVAMLFLLMVWDTTSDRLLGQQLSTESSKTNAFAVTRYTISGTGQRNNPLRTPLKTAFAGDELFVRFYLRYDADSIDSPPATTGEFFVMWLDESEGNDGSGHAEVPNLGLHVRDQQNRFMVRFHSSNQKFGPVLEGDRDYLILGRLWKSTPGPQQPFDQLSLWINPKAEEEFSPHVSVSNSKSISQVSWIGFSTGAKTEIDDRIDIWEIRVGDTWPNILDLPPGASNPNYDPGMPRPPSKKTVTFRKQIQPLLESRCFECHAGQDASEGIRLDLVDEVLNQITPLRHQASRLYEVVAEGKMPPKGPPLNDEELGLIALWIDEGLEWDSNSLPTPIPKSDHWAFQSIRRPEIPSVKNRTWVSNAIDAFIAARHESVGLVPNPVADTQTLNRRLSLNLLGTPPKPDQIERPLKIDRLLADPAYGEHFARHWLDVARWAESNGHQHNRNRPHAWRYRDWVIAAFNQGKSFDDFLREQIAGDEIQPFSSDQIVATGFLAAARYSGNELDKRIQRNDILVDVTNTTASAFLGLTFECAQCHSHKFDPISIRDYYRFQAFFTSGQPQNIILTDDNMVQSTVDRRWEIFNKVEQRLIDVRRKQGYPNPVLVTPETVIKQMNKAEKVKFDQLNQQLKQLRQSWSYYSPSTAATRLAIAPHEMRWPLPRDPNVLAKLESVILLRGDLQSRGPTVQPGWPLLFGHTPDRIDTRLQLADWLTDAENPLTARVWVNRLWQWHFGRGLVETTSDFGTQGTYPTHPLLLDYLASELINKNWNTQHIQRMIIESSTYRMSSAYSPANANIDPSNRLLWRFEPRRLQAEAVRDSILEVSGLLDRQAGGPSVTHDSLRRSVYLMQKRDNLPAQQTLFDGANGVISCSLRRVSTNPLQPLWLMNNDLLQSAAEKLAQRAGDVKQAIRIALHREGDEPEVQELERLAKEYGLSSACLAIMNSSEFLYVP